MKYFVMNNRSNDDGQQLKQLLILKVCINRDVKKGLL